LKEHRADDARASLRTCRFLWPFSDSVRLMQARAARLAGDFDEAEAYLLRVLKSDGPSRDAAQLEFLLLRVQAGDLEAVEQPLINCVDNGHPESPLILETLANAHMRSLRYGPARIALDRWLELDPSSAIAHQHRGWILERANDPKGAIADYARAVELAPDSVPPRLRLAELLLGEKETATAAGHLERLHKRHPRRAEVLARLGQCRYQQGETEEARRLLESAVERLPDDPLVLIHLAKLDLEEQMPAQAERWLRKLLALDPADAEGQFTLVKALRKQGRDPEADEEEKRYKRTQRLLTRVNLLLRDEVDKHPGHPGAPAEAGIGLLELGQERLALHWLHEALRRDPRHQPTHRALAGHYERKKDEAKAAYHRRQLVGAAP
ncbi:MAG: tetratricopeptide repeat protein, partial [Gemmataceae bacterium]|nr:tetratricopeptide repeat protein [Gemmataceae bacterium]